MSEAERGRTPELEWSGAAHIDTLGKDPRDYQTRGTSGDPAECEAFLNHQGRYGWVLDSISEGPPWNRMAWLTLVRPAGSWTDGRGASGEPLHRHVYRVIGRRPDLVDRGEQERIDALVAAGWGVVGVLRAQPWNERPVTFLAKVDTDVIEVIEEPDDEEQPYSEALDPQQRTAAIARVLAEVAARKEER